MLLYEGRIGPISRRVWKWDGSLRVRGFCEHLDLATERILGDFSTCHGQGVMQVQIDKCLQARDCLDRAGSPILGSTLGSGL